MNYKGVINSIGVQNTWCDACFKCDRHEVFKYPSIGDVHYCNYPKIGFHMIYCETLDVCYEEHVLLKDKNPEQKPALSEGLTSASERTPKPDSIPQINPMMPCRVRCHP